MKSLLLAFLLPINAIAARQVLLPARMEGQGGYADSRKVESSRYAVPDGSTPAAAPIMTSPICPSHFWIAQRHDRRNKRGEIVRAHWTGSASLSDRK